MTIFVATFGGLGNFLGTLPLLRGIASQKQVKILLPEPTDRFSYSAHEMLGDGLELGYYPRIWRRFALEHWDAILELLRRENVTTVLNWRNEGPSFDTSYYAFRRAHSVESQIQFFDAWDLTATSIGKFTWWELAVEVTRRWAPLIEPSPVSPLKRHGTRIDLFPIASTITKQWTDKHWCDLVKMILEVSDRTIGLHFPPDSLTIMGPLRELARRSEDRVSSFGPFEDFPSLVALLKDCAIAVTLDSFPAHLCVLLGIPCVTYFRATDPKIWAHRGAQRVLGGPPLKCSDWKPLSGNCLHYYDECNSDCATSAHLSASDVGRAVFDVLDNRS